MKIKHHEIKIPQENPFANCKLAREPYARVLTDIVNTYADGFVLAINNEWGTGKTTFVKMWQQQLKNDGFQTIYFNAWENDFDSNPLVALMSELETLSNAGNKKVFKSVVKKGAVLVKNIAPALAKSLIKKYVVDIDEIAVDAIENATKASTEILEEEIKEYSSKKKTIVEFRMELEKFVKQADNTKPLIFIVDELDRCRPTYAVEVLEQIKHFFSVSGIVFVLSIDKKHLGAAVRGVYGSEHIDANEYLRRFIDLEYSIPKPSVDSSVNYLISYYGIDKFIIEQSPKGEEHYYLKDFNKISKFLFNEYDSPLRTQERITAYTRLVLSTFRSQEPTFPILLFLLIFLKNYKSDFYASIRDKKLSLQNIADGYTDLVNSFKQSSSNINFRYYGAMLIYSYSKSFNPEIEFLKLQSDELKSDVIFNLANNENQFIEDVKSVSRMYYGVYKLHILINKIELTDSVTIQ